MQARGKPIIPFPLLPVPSLLHPFPVGAPRLELGTSALSGPRSNQLSYAPGPKQADHFSCAGPTAEGVENRASGVILSFCHAYLSDV